MHHVSLSVNAGYSALKRQRTMRIGANALFMKSIPEHSRITLFITRLMISVLESILLRQFVSKETMHTFCIIAKENTHLKEKRFRDSMPVC